MFVFLQDNRTLAEFAEAAARLEAPPSRPATPKKSRAARSHTLSNSYITVTTEMFASEDRATRVAAKRVWDAVLNHASGELETPPKTLQKRLLPGVKGNELPHPNAGRPVGSFKVPIELVRELVASKSSESSTWSFKTDNARIGKTPDSKIPLLQKSSTRNRGLSE